MDNPHAERQNVILQRIVKNAETCAETIVELNECLRDLLIASMQVPTAAALATKYRTNVAYNLAATGVYNSSVASVTKIGDNRGDGAS